MKLKLTALLLFSSFCVCAIAQNQKEVYGSFEAGCKVFNYHFKQTSNQISAFSINEIGKDLQLLGLEKKKLDTTIRFFDALTLKLDDTLTKSSISTVDKKAFNDLKDAFVSLKGVASEAIDKVGNLMNLSDRKGTVDTLFRNNLDRRYDSILRNFYGKAPGEQVYSITNIVNAVYDLMQVLSGRQAAEYTYFNEFRQDVFEKIFASYMKPFEPSFSPVCPCDLNRLASQVFGSIKARLDFFDDEPVTAYLKLKDKRIRVYISNELTNPKKKIDEFAHEPDTSFTKEANTVKYKKTFKPQRSLVEGIDYLNFVVDNVSTEFEDGNIKNLFVDLTHINKQGERGLSVRFRNNMPISVSNKFDAENFEYHKIFAGKPCEVYRVLRNRGVIASGNGQLDRALNVGGNCNDLFFQLSDLLEYLMVAENDKEDYSPANKVYELNEQNPVQQLKKEKRSKILVLKAYSDFIGINDDQPNGLIQFEASKRINVLTSRKQLSRTNYRGWFTYMEPRILFSKLEQNNKYLYLDRNTLDTMMAVKQNIKSFTVDPLQIYQYANFSIQTDFNIYKFNWSNAKSNFQVNARFGYYRTAVSDSVNVIDSLAKVAADRKTDNINSRMIGLTVLWEFKPDSRYGISLGYELQHIKPYNDHYSIRDGFKNLIQTFYFDGYLNTNNEGGRLFFRTRFNQLFNKWNRNFMQVQLGYALNIFKTQ